MSLVKLCESFDKEFMQLVEEAEAKRDLNLLFKGTALKRKSEEKRAEMNLIDADFKVLKDKRQKVNERC